MPVFIYIVLLGFNINISAKTIAYGRLEDSSKTFYPKTHLDLIEIAAKYSPLLQENHLKLINAKDHLSDSIESLQPKFSLDSSWQKNEDQFSELPNIAVSARWKNRYGGTLSSGLTQSRNYNGINEWMPTLHYQQPLLRGFGAIVNTSPIESAKDDIEEIQIMAQEHLSQLILGLEKKLTQATILNKKIELTKQMISLNDHQMTLRKKRIEAGEIAKSVLNNIQLSGQKLKLQLSDLEKEQIHLLGAIRQMAGTNVSLAQLKQSPLSTEIENFNPESADVILKIAKQHAFDLKHFQLQQKSVDRALQTEKNATEMNANVYVQTESWERKAQWGVSVNIPLNDHQNQHSMTRIKTQKRQQQISFAHMKNQMENKINQYIELIKKSKQGLDFSALSLKQSKQVWETYQKKYRANLVSALEVEKSFLDWYDSAIIYIEKSQSLTLSKIEVLHSIGYLLPILNLKLAPDDEIQL